MIPTHVIKFEAAHRQHLADLFLWLAIFHQKFFSCQQKRNVKYYFWHLSNNNVLMSHEMLFKNWTVYTFYFSRLDWSLLVKHLAIEDIHNSWLYCFTNPLELGIFSKGKINLLHLGRKVIHLNLLNISK